MPFQSAKQRPFYCHSIVGRDKLHCNAVVDDDPGDWAPIDIDALSRQVEHVLRVSQDVLLLWKSCSEDLNMLCNFFTQSIKQLHCS